MRGAPFWPGLEALAHTLPYEGRIMGYDGPDRSLPVERWQAIEVPVLAMVGDASPDWCRTWCAPWRGASRSHVPLAPGADPPGRSGGGDADPPRVLPRLRVMPWRMRISTRSPGRSSTTTGTWCSGPPMRREAVGDTRVLRGRRLPGLLLGLRARPDAFAQRGRSPGHRHRDLRLAGADRRGAGRLHGGRRCRAHGRRARAGDRVFSRVSVSHGAKPWTLEDVGPPAALRLFRAPYPSTGCSIPTGADQRTPVEL